MRTKFILDTDMAAHQQDENLTLLVEIKAPLAVIVEEAQVESEKSVNAVVPEIVGVTEERTLPPAV